MRIWTAGLCLVLASAVSAQTAEVAPLPTTYLAMPVVDDGPMERQSPKGKSLASYILRPEFAVLLKDDLDPQIARRSAVKDSFPFVRGRVLYGWRERPGLYCDLMRNRGLGSSTACLRDTNADGKFDEAVRFDFNSVESDVVFITDKGKVRGGRFKRAEPLPHALAYEPIDPEDRPHAQVELLWEIPRSQSGAGQSRAVDLFVSDGPNFTGTEILGGHFARIRLNIQPEVFEIFGTLPSEIDFYGVRVGIIDITAEGDLRYTLQPVAQDVPIGFVFRGEIINLMIFP